MIDRHLSRVIVLGAGALLALVGLAVLLALPVGTPEVSFAQEPDVGIQASLGSGFTYQG